MVKTAKLLTPHQTAAEMARLVKQYAMDLGDKLNLSLPEFFVYVANLSYLRDPPGLELVVRPKFSMIDKKIYRDCKKKSILMGAYLYAHKIPFKFMASSSRIDQILHHVFPVAWINGKPIVLDATYKGNKIGKLAKNISRIEPLTGFIE